VLVNGLTLLVTSYDSLRFLSEFTDWLGSAHDLCDEVVVVDDVSSDGTYEALLCQARELPNMKVLRTLNNSGRPAVPRNIGLSAANYSRVVFCDIDDILPLAYLRFLSTKSASQDLYSGVKVSTSVPQSVTYYDSDFGELSRLGWDAVEFKNVITLSGASAPTALARKIKFVNEPLEDWLFWRAYRHIYSANSALVRLRDVPVGYWAEQTLSPRKSVQLSRVYSILGARRILLYFSILLVMKLEEWQLKFRVRAASKPLPK